MKKRSKTLLEILDLSNETDTLSKIIQRREVIDRIKSKADPDAIVLEDFDDCIIGVDKDGRIVYDIDLMRTHLVRIDLMDSVDADEYLYYDLLRIRESYHLAPVFVCLEHELIKKTYE